MTTTPTRQKFLLAAIFTGFLVSGNSEAQTAQQLQARQQLIDDYSLGVQSRCVARGIDRQLCSCVAGGARTTPVADVAAATILAEAGFSTANSNATKYLERVLSVCMHGYAIKNNIPEMLPR